MISFNRFRYFRLREFLLSGLILLFGFSSWAQLGLAQMPQAIGVSIYLRVTPINPELAALVDIEMRLSRIELLAHELLNQADLLDLQQDESSARVETIRELRAVSMLRDQYQTDWLIRFSRLSSELQLVAFRGLLSRAEEKLSVVGASAVSEARLIDALQIAWGGPSQVALEILRIPTGFYRRMNLPPTGTPIDTIESIREEFQFEIGQNLRQLKESEFVPSTSRKGNIVGTEFDDGEFHFTFDDGPSQLSDQIMRSLDLYTVRATFFWLSPRFKNHSDIVDKLMRSAHEIANHTRTHPNMPTLSSSRQHDEIVGASDDIEKQTGRRPRWMRLPYGSGVNNSRIRQIIADAGMIHVFWNIDSLDWQDRDPDSITRRVMSQVRRQKRGILLFHDIHRQTVQALPKILDQMNREGFLGRCPEIFCSGPMPN